MALGTYAALFVENPSRDAAPLSTLDSQRTGLPELLQTQFGNAASAAEASNVRLNLLLFARERAQCVCDKWWRNSKPVRTCTAASLLLFARTMA
jgi:hypothetical protein